MLAIYYSHFHNLLIKSTEIILMGFKFQLNYLLAERS